MGNPDLSDVLRAGAVAAGVLDDPLDPELLKAESPTPAPANEGMWTFDGSARAPFGHIHSRSGSVGRTGSETAPAVSTAAPPEFSTSREPAQPQQSFEPRLAIHNPDSGGEPPLSDEDLELSIAASFDIVLSPGPPTSQSTDSSPSSCTTPSVSWGSDLSRGQQKVGKDDCNASGPHAAGGSTSVRDGSGQALRDCRDGDEHVASPFPPGHLHNAPGHAGVLE